ncbi:MAG: CheR family methyltransferase [Terriglobales bacterium]
MQPMGKDSRSEGAAELTLSSASSLSSFHLLSSEISEREFLRLRDLIYGEAGIWLTHAKTALLVGRLAKRLRHHGLKSFKQYYDLVINSPEERVQMLDALSTNETHFFREPQHFELLKSAIFPKWAEEAATGLRGRKIRVLSAGCSTGQEPYSLAMILLDHFPATAGWEIEIVATDLSTRALEIARNGIWPAAKKDEIPSSYLKAFMLKGFADQAGKMRAGPEIRSIIRFFRMNLNEPAYPLTGKFEMIFCRNVLIYFDQRSRERVVRRLANFLSPDGYLFLGHAESLHAMSDRLRSVIPTVYIGKDDAINDAKS